MNVEVQCPTCATTGQVTDAKVGKAMRCKQCGEVFKATVRPATPAAPAPAEVPPPPPVATPAASAVPAPPATATSDEPPAFAEAVKAANYLDQAVNVVALFVFTGCVLVVLAGAANGHGGEAVVVAVLAGVQMFLALVGARLVASVVGVFVGLARDVRAVRKKLGEERAG